ncbi:MAG: M48 family metallopeptidase [Bacteroidales bacterium]|nr:M48 family metallopeptidase [Bacteroidales bacterium]
MNDIPVIITRRRTSRITIRITKDGQVRVSAPRLVPRSTIEKFVAEHRDWIEKHLDKTAARQQKREEFYAGLDISTPKLRKEAVGKLDAIVAPLVEKYSEQMGVKPSGIFYRATKSRWGSCNAKTRRINFSLYLLLLPDWCIEHIVVHELAHLKEPNHGPRFYAIMDKYFPRWKEARKETAI